MSGEKTEEPTPRKLRKLRRKGEIPVSRELNRAGALLGAVAGLAATAKLSTATLAAYFRWVTEAGPDSVLRGFAMSSKVLIGAALPVVGGAAIGAIIAGALQTGLLLAPQRVMPDMKRFTPGQVWTQRFRKDALINGVFAACVAIAGVAAAWLGFSRLEDSAISAIGVAQNSGLPAAIAVATQPLVIVGAAWLGIAAFAAIADTAWQRNAFISRHRMSRQEVIDEYKQSEGDPEHKARREQAHRDILATSVPLGVAESDVIIRNPTHIAVGLRYDPDTDEAPFITIAGRGALAEAIIREGKHRRKVEVVDVPTARVLVDIPIGDPIPHELFEPVAVIFRWLQTFAPPG